MQEFTNQRAVGPTSTVRDQLWICEHPPVFTQGLAGKPEHIFLPGDIPVVPTNRGGQVTYHGPGQVVGYPLIDLKRAGYFVKEYVYRIEEAVIKTLAHLGVTGHRVAGRPYGSRATGAAAPKRCSWQYQPRFHRPGQDCRFGHQGQPQLHLPRRGAECGHGPGTLLAYQSLRLCQAANCGSFYNRGLCRLE